MGLRTREAVVWWESRGMRSERRGERQQILQVVWVQERTLTFPVGGRGHWNGVTGCDDTMLVPALEAVPSL